MKRHVLLSWSSGKDCAWALCSLRRDPEVEVVGLLTSVSEAYGRVTLHSTRRAIVEAQARSVGLPLYVVRLPTPCSSDAYAAVMRQATADAVRRGVTDIAFGDLFLEDVRAYRIHQLAGSGLQPTFPLWHEPTELLARRMVDAGVVAVVICVDLKRLAPAFAGRTFDHALLDELPPSVDPCGEHGEFHTCVIAGPMFKMPIPVTVGERVTRDGFCFADLVLATNPSVDTVRPPPSIFREGGRS